MKQRIIIAILVLAALAGGYYYYNQTKPKNQNELTLYGNVEIRQVDLGFQIAGQIEKLLVEEGETVKPGQVIGRLDTKDYEASLMQAKAQVAQAAANEAAQADIYRRNKALLDQAIISPLEFEKMTHNKEAGTAGVQAAEAAAKLAENQLKYAELVAPEGGIVISRVQEPGAIVAKGQTVYTLAKEKPMWIRAYIPEQSLGNIYYDMPAEVLTDTVDPTTAAKHTYKGRVGYISPTAEFTPKTVQTQEVRSDLVYRVRIYVDQPDKFLRQGMPTTVKLALTGAKDGQGSK